MVIGVHTLGVGERFNDETWKRNDSGSEIKIYYYSHHNFVFSFLSTIQSLRIRKKYLIENLIFQRLDGWFLN